MLFGARVLKRRPPGEGATPNRIELWLFQGANADEIARNFHATIPASGPFISTGFHSPGPPAPCASMQKPSMQMFIPLPLVHTLHVICATETAKLVLSLHCERKMMRFSQDDLQLSVAQSGLARLAPGGRREGEPKNKGN